MAKIQNPVLFFVASVYENLINFTKRTIFDTKEGTIFGLNNYLKKSNTSKKTAASSTKIRLRVFDIPLQNLFGRLLCY